MYNTLDKQKGDVGRLLTGLRIIFDNPAIRAYLRLGTKRTYFRENGRWKKAPIIYISLSNLAGARISNCGIMERFLSIIIKETIKMGVKVLRGDINKASIVLRDPSVRRGVSLVFEGLAMYGVTTPQKLPSPFLIVWNFTNMCNLRCIHCYQRADKPLPDELSLEEKINVVKQLDEAGVAAVALSGGEPTIHPHFLRIIEELDKRDIYAAVATNGLFFSEKKNLKKAVEKGLRYVEVSIDSAKPEVHDRFRGVKGAWKRAVKALENAVDIGITSGMAVTVTQMNKNEITNILDLAEKIGVDRVIFFNFIPTGRGKDNVWLDLSPKEREVFHKIIYKEMKKRGIEIESTAPLYARVVLEESSGKEVSPTHFYVGEDLIVNSLAEFVGGCGAGRIYAAIQPNGDVAPCVFLPIKVGNLREKHFREIWLNSPLLKQLRNRELLKGYCSSCKYKYVCGGCRARGYSYFNDIQAPDPGCILNTAYWKKIVKETMPGKDKIEKEAIH